MKLFPNLTAAEIDAMFDAATCGEPQPQIVCHKPHSYVPPVERGLLVVNDQVVPYALPGGRKSTPSSMAKAALFKARQQD